MRVVRGRADARWLPSRSNFALFRLYAVMRMRTAKPEPADVVLVIDRHQNAAENFLVGAWTTLTLAAYVAAVLSRTWGLPLAIAAAIPVALLLLQSSIVSVGILLIRRENNLRLNSVVLMVLMTGAAVVFARSESWARYAAWQFLAVLAINAVAAVALMMMRGAIAATESSVGGFSSEL